MINNRKRIFHVVDYLFRSNMMDSDRPAIRKWLQFQVGDKHDQDGELQWYDTGDNDNIMESHFNVWIRDREIATLFALTYPQVELIPTHFDRLFAQHE
jgi:hypothetical protein